MRFAKPSWTSTCILAVVVCIAAAPLAAQDAGPAESSAAAVRQFRDAAAFQDRGVYDLAADEWNKFLEQFPADPLAPKARHYLGVCQLLLKKYDAAADNFTRVLRDHPGGDLADSTYLNLGLAQYSLGQAGQKKQYDAAIKTFSTLAEKFPESKELPQALYYQGEALYAQGQKKQAAKAYAQLIDKYPQSPHRAQGLYALGVARHDTGQVDAAGNAYDLFLKEFPRHELRAEVILRRAETLASQGHADAAAKWFASAAASRDFKLADLAAMRQAETLDAAGQRADAAALFAALPEKFPDSKYREPALLSAGNGYAETGNLAAAAKAYQAVIDAGGERADDAAHLLARAYLKNNQPREALAVVEPAIAKSADADFAMALLVDKADAVYAQADRRREAIALYAAAADEHPDDDLAPQALYMAAFAALGQADYEAAVQYCDRFLTAYAKSPLAPDVRYVAAESALQLKQYDLAAKLYAELVEKHAGHEEVNVWQVRRALALHLERKFAEVAALLAPLVGRLKTPQLTAEAQYLLGSAQGELGNREAAATALRASLAAEPHGKNAAEALFALSAVWQQSGDTPGALATLERLSAEFPDSKLADQAAYRSGQYAASAGDFALAAKHYARVLEAWPQSPLAPRALYGLAWAQMSTGDYAAAEVSLGNFLQQYRSHELAPQAHYLRARVREQLANYAGAAEDVAAFLKSNPPAAEKLDALYVQGLCLAGLQQFDQAAGAFRSILKQDPNFADADKVLYELAWALRSADKNEAAIEAFATLADKHADSPLAAESFYHLGEDAYQRGDFARAASHYEAARGKAGTNDLGEKAAHKLGWSQYQRGELAAAAQTFTQQLSDFPGGELAADAQFMLAEALFAQEQYDEAVVAYRKTIASGGASHEFQALAHLHAGQALGQQKKWNESLELLDGAIRRFADSPYLPELRYEAAWAQQNLGQTDLALKRYEQVVGETDREVAARARFMMGEILFEKRQFKEAIRNFFKVAYGYGYPEAPEPVRVWQANASYEAGRCFEVLKMTDQARKSYQEVVERYPTSDKARLAQNRLEALGT